MTPLTNPKHEAFAQAYLRSGNASQAAKAAGVAFGDKPPLAGAYVYLLLCHEREKIIYVGKGTGNRMFHHVRDVKNGRISGLKKYKILRDLIDRGLEPHAVTVHCTPRNREAIALERMLICRIGFANLANSMNGFRNLDEKVITCIDQSISRIKPFDVWLSEAPRSQRQIDLYRKIVAEFQRMKSDIFARVRVLTVSKSGTFCNGVRVSQSELMGCG